MTNHNTFSQAIYTAKRSIFHFASKLSEGLQKPNKNFILDMVFGLAKGKSVVLSDIARTLEEGKRVRDGRCVWVWSGADDAPYQ